MNVEEERSERCLEVLEVVLVDRRQELDDRQVLVRQIVAPRQEHLAAPPKRSPSAGGGGGRRRSWPSVSSREGLLLLLFGGN